MTLLEILVKAGGESKKLIDMLEWVKAEVPDLAGTASDILERLDAPLAPSNIANVAVATFPELVNIAQGKLDPRKHPGDVV